MAEAALNACDLAYEKGIESGHLPEQTTRFLQAADSAVKANIKRLSRVQSPPGGLPSLIMIVGAPRSGTSMLENILVAAGIQDVVALGEAPVLHHLAQQAEAELGTNYLAQISDSVAIRKNFSRRLVEALSAAVTEWKQADWLGDHGGSFHDEQNSPYTYVTKWPLDFTHIPLAALLLEEKLR
eukprot:27834-Amphidinium_carterae.1